MTLLKGDFLRRFVAELRAGNAAFFVGAGLSKSAGYVDWVALIEPLAREIQLDAKRETDLVALAQYYLNAKGNNRAQISQHLVNEFADVHDPTETHEILARLPVRTFWTTNYDALLERALQESGKRTDVKYTNEHLIRTTPHRDVTVFKMHGHVDDAHRAILTRDDYEGYYRTHEPFVTALSGALVSTTFCFVGFSFSDPNLAQVLSHIRVSFKQNQRPHFCITRRVSRNSFEKDEDFEYARVKQEVQRVDLLRYNIETVYVDDFKDIPELLSDLERAYRVKTVFVSGSASTFDPWSREEAESFLRQMAAMFVRKRLKITTGFGLGVGGPIVTGAVQEVYSRKDISLEEALVMRPFPIGIQDEATRTRTFERYRKDLVSQAGIAIFVFGSRDEKADIAKGMLEEFAQAKNSGLKLLPIGATGHAAKQLWEEVDGNFASYFPQGSKKFRELFNDLGKVGTPAKALLEVLEDAIDILIREGA